MADEKIKLTLTNVRLSFAKVYKPEGFKGSDENKKYQGTFLINMKTQKDIIKQVKQQLEKCAENKWPGKVPKSVNFNKNKCCVRIGEDMDNPQEGYEGHVVIKASNKAKPRLLSCTRNAKGKFDEILEKDGLIYGGAFVNARVNLWAQDNDWGKRINCELQAIQFVAHGESFEGGGIDPNVADDFDEVDEPDDEDFDDEDDDDEDDDDLC